LTAALRWAVGADPETALRLVGALGWYWWLGGHRTEAAVRAREALAAGRDVDSPARALSLAVYVLNGVGTLLTWDEGEQALAEMRHPDDDAPPHPIVALAGALTVLYGSGRPGDDARVRELCRHSDPWAAATGQLLLSLVHFSAGRIGEGEREALAALAGYRAAGDRWGTATALACLADVHFLRGEIEPALEIMHDALDLLDELGSVEDTAYTRARMALGLNLLGRREESERLLVELAGLVSGIGDEVGEAGLVAVLGDFRRHDGDLAAAREHYARAQTLMDSARGVPGQMVSAVNSSRGLLAVQEGDLPEARRLLALALKQATEGRDAQLIGVAVIACAAVALAAGRPQDAAALLGGAETIRGVAAVVDHDHVRITAEARAALGEREFDRHHGRGRRMSRDEVAGLALRV